MTIFSDQFVILFYLSKYSNKPFIASNQIFEIFTGSREQAYVYALSAAILSQTVAKACGRGASTKCGCGQEPNEPAPGDFKWGGCGDDVNFGILFSKWFTDSPWTKPKDSKNHLINIHNSEVGRKVS